MAEGFEEGAQENNSNGGGGGAKMDAIAMVAGITAPKCDSSPHLASNSHISSLGSNSSTATVRDFIAESAKIPPSSPSPSSAQQHQLTGHQSQPINLKSEVSASLYVFRQDYLRVSQDMGLIEVEIDIICFDLILLPFHPRIGRFCGQEAISLPEQGWMVS